MTTLADILSPWLPENVPDRAIDPPEDEPENDDLDRLIDEEIEYRRQEDMRDALFEIARSQDPRGFWDDVPALARKQIG